MSRDLPRDEYRRAGWGGSHGLICHELAKAGRQHPVCCSGWGYDLTDDSNCVEWKFRLQIFCELSVSDVG